MDLRQFGLHRPQLESSLMDFLMQEEIRFEPRTQSIPPERWWAAWDIQPRYEDEVLFVAKCEGLDPLVCVSHAHPRAMNGPTWWWQADL